MNFRGDRHSPHAASSRVVNVTDSGTAVEVTYDLGSGLPGAGQGYAESGKFGLRPMERYYGTAGSPELEAVVRKQAAKRVALQFKPRKTASFDHRKLGGVY